MGTFKRWPRLLALVAVVTALFWVGAAHANGETGLSTTPPSSAPPSDGVTVVATQGMLDPAEPGHLVAYGPDGDRIYLETESHSYFDVDPVPGTSHTVEVVTSSGVLRDCPGHVATPTCTRSSFVRVNVSTGERRVVWSHVTPRAGESRTHDMDRINRTHVAVADIATQSVFAVATRTDERSRRWRLASVYDPSTAGGPRPDWAHLNDVEVLDDGRFMLSPRNLDSVVFVRNGTYQRAWTLGSDDDHSVLDEQHNPDYLPANRGGPAVLVADSHNNRVVEYQREDGSWTRSWSWTDRRLHWPRDADRLPNGHTLVTDSNGDRVVEVDRRGAVVWSVPVDRPYEAERLGTGDESAGGPSARSLDLPTRGLPSGPVATLKGALPTRVVEPALFVAPPWFGFVEVAVIGVTALYLLGWLHLEAVWAISWLVGRVRPLLSDRLPS